MTDTKQETKQVGELEKLTPEQAIGLLIQGIKIGQSKGAFTLEEAPTLLEAISAFQLKEGQEQPAKDVQEAALGNLIGAILRSQEKGAFTLEDAAVLGKAVAVFKGEPNPAPVPEVSEDPEATEVVETEEVK